MTAVLYDIPGPKARIRNAGTGVVGVLLIVALLGYVLYRMIVTGQFDGRLWTWIEYKNIQLLLLNSLLATLQAFAMAAVLSLVFGAIFAAGRLSDHRWVSRPATAIVEFFRALPLLVLIFILFYGASRSLGLNVSEFWALTLGLTLYNGSVLAEIFRSGVLALPKGQREAAFALGMRKTQVMTNVLLPQSLRAMLPTILSQLVVVLKDTALGFLILYPELLYQARYLGSQGQLGGPILQVGMVVAVIYIAMCLLLSALTRYLERRTRRNPKIAALDPVGAARAQGEVTASSSTGVGGA
ncbi:amino acid ABC transporter permease [Pseudonocardia spinosispora]|uniref:amino acid ABC transporter permease n=1 Tax=Pseudonocardia spinosispora TaxID=103441 RepID=UPI00042228EA|nr:amino acid ABC transporter permease [Pseudonocardia spinosispora]